ncbi:hypothetical protein DV515_00011863 [Chloebia gouldiae]|uniref:Uncharacterized protein n=1 Tax=Chloebia gouldiae TaxID=44316 RepID=A0A3L8S514_CHLGU|nr:hypothetical protein DV515_00011863 [Chloebia gouldiae]
MVGQKMGHHVHVSIPERPVIQLANSKLAKAPDLLESDIWAYLTAAHDGFGDHFVSLITKKIQLHTGSEFTAAQMGWDKVDLKPAQQMAVISSWQPQSHLDDAEQQNNRQRVQKE